MEQQAAVEPPWSVTRAEFLAAASTIGKGGACCLFIVDASIPPAARFGYAALVIAYARSAEPVTMVDDSSAALLITEGGPEAGRAAAERLMGLLRRLSLEGTMHTGVAPLGDDVEVTLRAARVAADAAPKGEVGVAD